MSLPSNNGDKPVVRVAIYVRKSSRKNLALEFNSLDAQRAACVRFANERANQGWRLIEEEFADGGISGKSTTNRPGWLQLMQRVEQGLVDVILVYRTERAFRSLRDFLVTMDHFNQVGVQLISISEPYTMDSAFGRAIGHLIAVINQLERELTGERIKDNIAERMREGKLVGGKPPFGYYLDRSNPNHKIARPHTENASMVKFIYERYVQCGSPATILRELAGRNWEFVTLMGLDNEPHNRRSFEVNDIRRILTNRFYAGWIYCRQTKESFEGEHEPIIPRPLFEAAQQAMAKGRRNYTTCAKTSLAGALKGICYCGPCNARMRLTYGKSRGKKYRFYVCSNVTRRAESKCSRRYFSASQLEQAAFDYLRKVFRAPEVCSAVLRSIQDKQTQNLAALRANKSTLRAQVTTTERELAKLTTNENTAYTKEAESQERDLRILKKQLADVEAQVGELVINQLSDAHILESLQNMDQVWELLEPYKQERMVRLLLESVTVYEDKLTFRLHVNGVRSLIDDITFSGSSEPGAATAGAAAGR